jgi:peptidoglycan/LPS O-acetylase OafA/YrhL
LSTADRKSDAGGNAYRPDIDGLRAVAVVSVILYHLSVPGFAGGLVGVDIFFVVSGFVITRLLRSHFPALTLVGFYERRVRRLAPALVTMLAASFLASYYLLLPADFEQFAKSLVATTLLASNAFFARQASDYFAHDATSKPLLHTWSLAVEEQFYLLYPVGLFLLLRHGATARTITNTILGAIAISFAIAVIGNWLSPASSFFFFPARIWELMLGALIALAGAPMMSLPARQALCVVGAIFIAFGIAGVRIGLSEVVPQPLIACLGTAILIYANDDARTIASAVLSHPILVGIGLLSYSLYLWHWPILVLYRYAVINRPLQPIDTATVAIVTLIISIANWKYIEQPFRKRRLLGDPAGMLLAAASASMGLLGVAVWGVATKGIPSRLPPDAIHLAEGNTDVNPDRSKCMRREPANVLTGAFCRLGALGAPSLMVWGDSQADPWMPVFNDLMIANGTSGLITASAGCPPLLGVKRFGRHLDPSRSRCTEINNAIFAAIAQYRINRVVLIGRWSWYIYGDENGSVEEGPGAIIVRADDNEDNAEIAARTGNRQHVFQAALAETVTRLREVGAQVWLIQEPPTNKVDIPKYLAHAALRGTSAIGRLRDEVRQRQAFQTNVFADNSLAVIDVLQYLCPSDEKYCRIALDGRSIYADWNHFSVFGARTIAKWAAPVFRKMTE